MASIDFVTNRAPKTLDLDGLYRVSYRTVVQFLRRKAPVREPAADAQRALAGLSPRDREVLLLWDAGLSYASIAERTQLVPEAVGAMLTRARTRLEEASESFEPRVPDPD